MLKLSAALISGRYDAVMTYQAAASIYGCFWGWLGRVPIRAAHHTASPEGIRPHWKAVDWMFGMVGIYTHMIVNSKATRDAFSAWPGAYRRRFVDIPHGVDALPESSDRSAWRKRLNISPAALILVATGRLAAQKDHATAIKSLVHIPGAHLIIAGDGPDRDALQALANAKGVEARTHLIGAVERMELGNILAAGDIYLFPSVWETFGLAGVEAAMAGLPVVASNLPVLREVLTAGDSSIWQAMTRFHAVRDDKGLSAAVIDLHASYPTSDVRDRYAQAHRQHHSQARMLDLYQAFLQPGFVSSVDLTDHA
jgi:glycosyltransferase involved in cell wall biosynthesis